MCRFQWINNIPLHYTYYALITHSLVPSHRCFYSLGFFFNTSSINRHIQRSIFHAVKNGQLFERCIQEEKRGRRERAAVAVSLPRCSQKIRLHQAKGRSKNSTHISKVSGWGLTTGTNTCLPPGYTFLGSYTQNRQAFCYRICATQLIS